MGQAEFSQTRLNEGVRYFEEAVKLNPATMESQWNLLTAYSLARQNDKADQVRNNMQKLGCDFKDLIQLKRLYNIYIMAERHDKIQEVYEEIIYVENK